MSEDDINLLKDVLDTLNVYIAMDDDNGSFKELAKKERDQLIKLIERLE